MPPWDWNTLYICIRDMVGKYNFSQVTKRKGNNIRLRDDDNIKKKKNMKKEN